MILAFIIVVSSLHRLIVLIKMKVKKLIFAVVCLLLLSALCALIIANIVQKQPKGPDFLRETIPNTNNYRANIKAFTEATPNPHALVSMITTTKPITDEPAKRNTTTKDILKGIGKQENKQQLIEESIYNEKLKMCWNDILYVNESNNKIAATWHEYQVTLDFPGDNNDPPSDETHKDYKNYIIRHDESHQNEHVFEVVRRSSNYIISKHENISCRSGTYLSKTYYEWPQIGNKRIVLLMTDVEHHGIKDEETEEFVGSPKSLKESVEFDMDDDSFEDVGSMENNANKTTEQSKAQNKDIQDSKTDEEDSLPQVNQTATTEYSQTRNQILPSVSPCSPVLTKLLSGNGILPGLCNLRKDETVVLQGDIVVFKKYYNVDHKEMVKPMFVIHEKTEIESKGNDTEIDN